MNTKNQHLFPMLFCLFSMGCSNVDESYKYVSLLNVSEHIKIIKNLSENEKIIAKEYYSKFTDSVHKYGSLIHSYIHLLSDDSVNIELINSPDEWTSDDVPIKYKISGSKNWNDYESKKNKLGYSIDKFFWHIINLRDTQKTLLDYNRTYFEFGEYGIDHVSCWDIFDFIEFRFKQDTQVFDTLDDEFNVKWPIKIDTSITDTMWFSFYKSEPDTIWWVSDPSTFDNSEQKSWMKIFDPPDTIFRDYCEDSFYDNYYTSFKDAFDRKSQLEVYNEMIKENLVIIKFLESNGVRIMNESGSTIYHYKIESLFDDESRKKISVYNSFYLNMQSVINKEIKLIKLINRLCNEFNHKSIVENRFAMLNYQLLGVYLISRISECEYVWYAQLINKYGLVSICTLRTGIKDGKVEILNIECD
jgi:hypothetical protein